MKLTIKRIILDNFKGAEHEEHDLFGTTFITGKNGAGKTTIADAHFWLWVDKDYALTTTPEIHPLYMEYSEPTVTEIIEIDGEEIEVKKIQKDNRTKQQIDSGAPVSIRNEYEINGVPKSKSGFVADMESRGIDFDKFLLLSHIDIFTSQKSADCRSILFGMVSDVTDAEIADAIDGCAESAELLKSHTAEEVIALQKRAKKQADEQLDAIPNQIIGLEKAKSDADVPALTARRDALQAEIDELKAQAQKYTPADKERLTAEITSAESELKAVGAKANAERLDALTIANSAVAELDTEHIALNADIERLQDKITSTMHHRDDIEKKYDALADEFAQVKAQEFTEMNCAYCGQPLPKDRVEELRRAFDEEQTARKGKINAEAQEIKRQIQADEDVVHKASEEVKRLVKRRYEVIDQLKEARERKALLDEPVDVTVTADYKTAWDKVQSLKADLEKIQAESDGAWELSQVLVEKGHEMKSLNDQIAQAEVNESIDKTIAEMKEHQKHYAQEKANAEKILYQMARISMEKNRRLTAQVNSHFDIVEFRLFEQQKNGDYKDCCVPTIAGRVFGESANTALIMVGQLDIIAGLSKFYGQEYPVFVDGAEAFDADTLSRIEMQNQMMYLCVSNDDLRVAQQ